MPLSLEDPGERDQEALLAAMLELADGGHPVSVSSVAENLGWSADHVRAVLGVIAERGLSTVGAELKWQLHRWPREVKHLVGDFAPIRWHFG